MSYLFCYTGRNIYYRYYIIIHGYTFSYTENNCLEEEIRSCEQEASTQLFSELVNTSNVLVGGVFWVIFQQKQLDKTNNFNRGENKSIMYFEWEYHSVVNVDLRIIIFLYNPTISGISKYENKYQVCDVWLMDLPEKSDHGPCTVQLTEYKINNNNK